MATRRNDQVPRTSRGWYLMLLFLPVGAFLSYALTHPGQFLTGAATHNTVVLPQLTMRLSNPEKNTYVRMTLEAELVDEQDREEVKARGPKIRDALLHYLADTKPHDLQGSEGMEQTKKEMLARLNKMMPDTPVRALYLTEYIGY